MQKEQNIIEVKDMTFAYDREPVLERVSLHVKKGDYLAILGPNGAAKSTLIKLMVGLLRPQRGKIKLFGEDITSFKNWGKIGYMAQQAGDVNISFPATVEEVVSSGYYEGVGNFNKKNRKRAVKAVLKKLEIDNLAQRLIGNLSGGQRQKVFLAKAIVKRPEIIFLDEPTSGIDVNYQKEFYKLIKKLNDENITIVMVTHDIKAAFRESKTIACVYNKNVLFNKSKDEKIKMKVANILEHEII